MRDTRRLGAIALTSLLVAGAWAFVVQPDDDHIELRELSPTGAASVAAVLALAIVGIALDSTYGMTSHPKLQPAARALCAALVGGAGVVALYAAATVFP